MSHLTAHPHAASPPGSGDRSPGAGEPSRYPTTHELLTTAHDLTARHPDVARLAQVGRSRGGRPLHLLSVRRAGHDDRAGRDPYAVLVVAGAHANEPVGAATVAVLARRVLADGELRALASWHFLLCADPDGARLHHSPAPRDLADYHRRFYRPAAAEQPEWSASLLPPHRTQPETLALNGTIDRLRPYLQVTLHATELGGSWVQLTRDIPGLAEPFAKSAAELNIPLDTGAPDAVGWPVSGPGVYVMPGPGEAAAFPSLPDDILRSTWHRAHRHGGLTAVVEVPMWASDLVGDPAPHPAPQEALGRIAARLRADAAEVAAVLAAAGAPPAEGPQARAARWSLDLMPRLAEDWLRPVAGQPTAAHVSSVDAFGRRLPLRTAAMLRRAFQDTDPVAAERCARLTRLWSASFADRFRARWVPLEDQVAHQARTVVAAARHARPA